MIGARIFVMACVRIAAVVIALLLSVELSAVELSAQPAPRGNVTIQVTDTTGAVIPGARIEVDPSPSKPGSVFETDSQGRAALDLPKGAHVLSITFLGFKRWTRQIDVQGGVSQIVDAKLEVAGTDDPIYVFNWAPYEFSVSSPEPVFLPLQPLLNLDPLPVRKAKRHW
jgi:hypothetical protein